MDEEVLFMINEKLVNFTELENKGLDQVKDVLRKIDMLLQHAKRSIYPKLVKDFWVYVSVVQDGMTIHSYVYGFSITITHSLIVVSIGYEEKGSTVERCRFNSTFSKSLIFNIYDK